MAVLLACGENGLIEAASGMHRHPCPLETVSLLCPRPDGLTVIDNRAHLLWDGHMLARVDAGIVAALPWRGHHLLLSGDTDSITLLDGASGQPVTLAPAGVYPQDMCLLPRGDVVAVCGGADGCIRLLALPALQPLRCTRVPGCAARITFACGCLYVLCTIEDDGLQTLLCRIPLRCERYEPLLTLPGMAGALAADASGSLWLGTSDTLYHIQTRPPRILKTIGGFGMISALSCRNGQVLLCDAAYDSCLLLEHHGLHCLRKGDVQHSAIWGSRNPE